MLVFDEGTYSQFPDYDLGVVEQRASAIQTDQRFSQAREAKKLEPVIRAILAAHSEARATEIADMIVAARKAGAEKLGPTFRREVGTIVHRIKIEPKKGSSGDRSRANSQPPSGRTAKRHIDVSVAPADQLPADGAQRSGSPSRTSAPATPPFAEHGEVSPAPVDGDAFTEARPYEFTSFAGKVYVHGGKLREFFSGVDKELPLDQLAMLVVTALADPEAKANLSRLAPADRAIFDAMADWARAHGF